MDHRLIEGLVEAVVPLVCDHVDEVLASAIDRLTGENKRLEGVVADLNATIAETARLSSADAILRLVDERVAKIPPVQPGKEVAALVEKAAASLDGMPAMVEAAVSKHVAALPKPEPLKGVTLDDLAPMVAEAVDKAVAVIEVPKGPDDALIALMIGEKVEATVSEAIKSIDLPKPESVTVEDVAPMILEAVEKAVEAIEVPKGPDADAIGQMVRDATETVLATWERPKDGNSVTADDLAPLIAYEVGKAVSAIEPPKDGVGLAGALINREGQLVVTMSDGKAVTLGVVVGQDVDMDIVRAVIKSEFDAWPKPKDGQDGVGFDDMALVDVDGDLFLRFTRGHVVKDFYLPVTTDRGVWTERAYRKGAAVSWGGQTFIAQRDALPSEKPMVSPPGDPWRMSVKKGRDGDSAFDVARKAGFRGTPAEWLDSLRPGPAKPVKVN